MLFRNRKPNIAEICLAGIRNDLWQIGASQEVCAEIASIRQRGQFEAIGRNRHLARDIGLIR